MNILIVNQYAVSPNQPGITRSFSFARELVARGHQVSIIAAGINHFTQKEEAKDLEVIEGVTFLWVKTPAYQGNSVKRIINMVSFAQSAISRGKTLETFDLVLGSSPHLLSGLAAQQLAAHWKVPFVLEVRDLWPESLIELGNFSRKHPVVLVLEQLERFLYRRAAKIITLLPHSQTHLQSKGATLEQIVWIPNGVQLGEEPQIPNPREKIVVLYAGSHGLINALESIVDTAAYLAALGEKHIEFHLIGDGPDKAKLLERAANLPNIHFFDAVPKSQMSEVLVRADLFILTLRNKALYKHGISVNKIFDYLGAARPIVFGGNASNNPVEEAGAGITVEPENIREMAEAILELANLTPKERLEMGLRGRKHVQEHYDLKVLGERLEKVLLEVLERSK